MSRSLVLRTSVMHTQMHAVSFLAIMLNVICLQQSLKQIAACIDDRDNNVRNAAINAIVVAWKEEGDRVFQLIGKMNDKSKAMLDERIKRSGVVSKARGSIFFSLNRL